MDTGLNTEVLTKTQIDRLGDRLRTTDVADSDLILLDQFRRAYSAGYEIVIMTIRNQLGFDPTGRPAKSTNSIIEKLQRETIRLSQMQDIAGCRFIVSGAEDQKRAVSALLNAFPDVFIDDRRSRPSHGYRAVHAIVMSDGKPIEVQVRTTLQHLWAELSEKYADVEDPSIKYGGGAPTVRALLDAFSKLIATLEQAELHPGTMNVDELEEFKQATRAMLQDDINDLRIRSINR